MCSLNFVHVPVFITMKDKSNHSKNTASVHHGTMESESDWVIIVMLDIHSCEEKTPSQQKLQWPTPALTDPHTAVCWPVKADVSQGRFAHSDWIDLEATDLTKLSLISQHFWRTQY